MDMPKSITGTVCAWFSCDSFGPDFVAQNPDRAAALLHYTNHDMSSMDGWSKAGTAHITVELLSQDDLFGAKLEALKAQKNQLMADHQMAMIAIEEKIQKLLAITNEVSA